VDERTVATAHEMAVCVVRDLAARRIGIGAPDSKRHSGIWVQVPLSG
jgi:hypothetical protein